MFQGQESGYRAANLSGRWVNVPQLERTVKGATLDERGGGKPSLPEAWRAAVRMCPYCSGLGKDHGADCVRCGGTGDLMRWMLEESYKRGREDGLAKMRETYAFARLAGEQVAQAPVPEDLRVIVGLPR